MDSKRIVGSSLLWSQLLASLLFVAIASMLEGKSNGVPSIHWMYVYKYNEFDTWDKIWSFLWDLRTGVSPFWGFIDAASFKIFGNIHLTEHYLYKGAMYLAFVVPIWHYSKKLWQVILAFGLSLLAIVATLTIHRGNPQVYDVYFPALILMLIYCLQWIRKPDLNPKLRIVLCVAAGLLFTISELTRPFVLLVVPFFIFGVWRMLRPYSRVHFVALMIPILLLSGSWHLKLLVRNGQVSWTNHTGFNLYQSWHDCIDYNHYMAYKEESPRIEGWGTANLNTDLHSANSEDLKGMIVRQIFRQPGLAVLHMLERAKTFWTPKRTLFSIEYPTVIYRPYQIMVWLIGLSLLLAMIFWGRGIFRKGGWKYLLDSFADPERMLMLFTVLNITIFIVAEDGEDARFLISVLPLLLCFPGLREVSFRNRN